MIKQLAIFSIALVTACGGANPSDLFDPAPQASDSGADVVAVDDASPDVSGDDASDASPTDAGQTQWQTTCVFAIDSGFGPKELQCTAPMCAATGVSPWQHVVAGSWVGCCTAVGAITDQCQPGNPCRANVAGNTFYGMCW